MHAFWRFPVRQAGSQKAALAAISPEDLNERTEDNGSEQWNQFWMCVGNRYFLEHKSLNLLGNRSRYLLLVLCGLLRAGEWAPDMSSYRIMKTGLGILSGPKPRLVQNRNQLNAMLSTPATCGSGLQPGRLVSFFIIGKASGLKPRPTCIFSFVR